MKLQPLHTLIAVTISATVTSHIVKQRWITIPVELAGVSCGIAYLAKSGSPLEILEQQREKQSDLENEARSLKERITQTRADLANEGQIIALEIEAKRQELSSLQNELALEREKHSTELNRHQLSHEKQIAEIEELLEDRFKEMEAEEHAFQRKLAQLKQQHEAELAEIAAKNHEELERQATHINEQLEEDKAAFLEEHQAEVTQLKDEIKLLKSELGAALEEIDKYQHPQFPEGVEQEAIAARRVMEMLFKNGILTDFRGAWIDKEFILVRIRPRQGGEKEIKRHLNRMQIELNLVEMPQITTVPGAVQLYLRPRSLLNLPVDSKPLSPAPQQHPEVEEELNREVAIATLNASYLKDFVEPSIRCKPYGPIQQIERDWVLWLWDSHKPRPVRNQKRIINRVWQNSQGQGIHSGDGSSFMQARTRLHTILKDAGIQFRSKE